MLIGGLILVLTGIHFQADSLSFEIATASRPCPDLATGPTLEQAVMALDGRLDDALEVE
jgi:hypothetical protein